MKRSIHPSTMCTRTLRAIFPSFKRMVTPNIPTTRRTIPMITMVTNSMPSSSKHPMNYFKLFSATDILVTGSLNTVVFNHTGHFPLIHFLILEGNCIFLVQAEG